jgi:NDP-sugar pyrophosphorylase family protein
MPAAAIILAAGLGTRMKQWTETIPKALIPVHGKPFAHHQLAWLARSGVTSVVYSIGHMGDRIRDAVGDGRSFGMKIQYVDEGTNLRGTGGAVRMAVDLGVMDPDFLVLFGDSYLPIELKPIVDYYQTRPEGALMTVLRNQGLWDASNVIYRDGRVVLYDKTLKDRKPPEMVYIDYGLSILNREAVRAEIPSDRKTDLAEFFHQRSLTGKLAGYEVKQRFFEIGSPQGLADFEAFTAQGG